ncbi:MAG: hypothetical protein LBS52_07960 [Dysgonamonadaceae bacterium]|jgi:hypothetical protein|nr:hypothetical protein [Dysgonamonadaceae bacterium]
MMKRNALILLLAILTSCGDFTLPEENEQIPILGWHGLPASGEYADVKFYKEMADAGFTINLPPGGWAEAESAPYFELLDKAHSVGLKIMVDWKVVNFFKPDELKRLKEHPALAGYTIRDEPSAKDFPALADAVRKIQAFDNEHPPYINLFPNYANEEQLGVQGADAYRKHVQQYIKEVPVPVVSYDHYCILLNAEKKRYIREGYYENLEIIADESRKAGKPFWAFALSTAHWDYPVPTLSDLRLQVYSDLAYGAQCIQFFTWFDPCCDEMWGEGADDNAPVRIDGSKSPSYYTVQAMNKEIKAVSKVFLNAKVQWTAHTGNIPRGCKELDKSLLPTEIKSLDISGSGALVSLIEKNGNRFLVLVNHDIEHDITISVKGSSKLRMLNKQGEVVKPTENQTLTPGDIAIFILIK